jgi:hypothetical protein
MRISDLVMEWERSGGGYLTAREYKIRLPLRDAAKIAALAAMYPLRNETEIISELLTAALEELERAMPYIQGSKIIARDELDDPIFEDVGPTPRFHALYKQYSETLESIGESHCD